MALLILFLSVVCLMLTAAMSCHNHFRLMTMDGKGSNNFTLMTRVAMLTDICFVLIILVSFASLGVIALGYKYIGGLCGYLLITFMTLAVTFSTRVACKITKEVVSFPSVYDLFLLGFTILYTGLLIATSKGF